MLNGYTEVDIPLNSYFTFARQVDAMTLAVSAAANPMALIHSFLELSPAFAKYKD